MTSWIGASSFSDQNAALSSMRVLMVLMTWVKLIVFLFIHRRGAKGAKKK
jgi:hypothetical protein